MKENLVINQISILWFTEGPRTVDAEIKGRRTKAGRRKDVLVTITVVIKGYR